MPITYIQRDVALLTGVHVVPGDKEFEMNLNTATAATVQSQTIGGGDSALCFAFTTPAGEPGVSWPTDDYRCQLDVNGVGADLTFGLRAAGAATGHFARVNTGLTSDVATHPQIEALFSGPGLHLATTGAVAFAAGDDANDRFECLIAATRPASHGNQTITLNVNVSNSFADGQWVPAGGGAPHYYQHLIHQGA